MEKLTTVDWLVNELNKKQNGDGSGLSYNQIFDRAKEMEKAQIIEAIVWARDPYGMAMGPNTLSVEKAEKYYNETYKSE